MHDAIDLAKDAARRRDVSGGADLPRKAPVKAVAQPTRPSITITGLGYGDHEHRSGFFLDQDLTANTNTYGGLAIANATFRLTGGNFLVLGVNGGESSTRTNAVGVQTRVTTPGAGVFVIYGLANGFSIDAAFNYDRDRITTTNFVAVTTTTSKANNYTSMVNLSYRFTPGGSAWWVEPTIGARYKDAESTLIGIKTTRVTGGWRWGTDFKWNNLTVEPILGVTIYSDVRVAGFNFPAPTDQGKVWGKGAARVNFNNDRGGTLFVEADGRGTSGASGFGGKIGLRQTFN